MHVMQNGQKKIAECIVHYIRSQDPPGRFLELDPSLGCWFVIDDEKALDKTRQTLRDVRSNTCKISPVNFAKILMEKNQSNCINAKLPKTSTWEIQSERMQPLV